MNKASQAEQSAKVDLAGGPEGAVLREPDSYTNHRSPAVETVSQGL